MSTVDAALVAQLERAWAHGALGPGPVPAHLAHARGFGAVAQDVVGGSPGASRRPRHRRRGPRPRARAWTGPNASWLFVDASGRRTADLSLAVQELGLAGRVVVRTARAEDVAHEPDHREAADLVTARSFAAPAVTAEIATGLVAPGGWVIVSEPPGSDPDRWPEAEPRPVRVRPGRGAGRGRRNLRRPPEAGRGAGGAPAPDATPRQTPGLVGPRPAVGQRRTDRSTFHVERRRDPCTARTVVVLSRAIVPRGTRASASAESPCEHPSQGTRGRSITDLEARWQPMTPSAAENGVGSAFWDPRRRRAPKVTNVPRPRDGVDLMERDAEAGRRSAR